MTQATVSPARRTETAAQLRRGRILREVRSILRHLLLALLAAIWLVPILWLLVTSFSTDRGINVRRFFPASYTVSNYINILFHPDSVAQFPRWFTNTLVVACFNCVISTCCCGFSVLLRKKTFVRKTPDFCRNMLFCLLVWMRRKE